MKLLKPPKPKQRKLVSSDGRPFIRSRLQGVSKVTLSKKPPVNAKAMKEAAQEKQDQLRAKAEQRRRYSEERGLPTHDARKNLAHLDKFAKVQVVTFPNGKVKEIPAIVPTALGEPLDTTGVTVTRWLKANMLPEPVLITSRGGRAYHLDEARSFIRIIGKHQETFRQYRRDHTTVTDELFRENALLRSTLFNVK